MALLFICCQPPGPDQLQIQPVRRSKPHGLNVVKESDSGKKSQCQIILILPWCAVEMS